MPTIEQLKGPAIALGLSWIAYKYLHKYFGGEATKAAALGVMGVIVAKQVPYVKDAI